MDTLLDLFADMERLGGSEAVLYDDGYRTRKWDYRSLRRHIAGVAEDLASRGIGAGDRVLLWGENRPEWLAFFWAALSRRITVVPVDFRSSSAFVSRVQKEVGAKLLAHGSKTDAVDAAGLGLPAVDFESIGGMESGARLERNAQPDDVVQILYTSGTTGEPKGIIHRHRHIVVNLLPIRREIQKYAKLARPFQPVRFLDLLPLSHVFGQFTGIYVPVAMGGAVAFLEEIHPGRIVEHIRTQRISVLVSVPRFLESLRFEIERRFDLGARRPVAAKGLSGGLLRFWRHWDVHRSFGLKFWAILAGGARLAPEEEAFWRRLGFVLVQGYGLTETSSLVSTNHPFHPTAGSLGKVVGDQQIRLAPDGEILVRGDNVSLEVFGQAPDATAGERWLHTGDLGEMGPDGTLYYKGRKKDVIVGPEGLNVFPADVESVLDRDPAVTKSVVVGRPTAGGEVVHAVLLLHDREVEPSTIVERANRELEHHQRIREWSLWPEEDFPRTPSTFKIRRYEVEKAVRERTEEPEKTALPTGVSATRALLAQKLGRSPEDLPTSLRLSEEIGLSSLDRVELLTLLEEHYGCEIPEAAMAEVGSLAELETLVDEAVRGEAPAEDRPRPKAPRSPLRGIVRYGRAWPVRLLRTAFREAVMLPLFRHYIPLTVEGSFEDLHRPVVFAPNHTSNLDTIALVAALPRSLRGRLAPAVSQDYFLPYLEGTGSFRERLSLGSQFWAAVLALNVFPLPQATKGVRDALEHAGRLVDQGYSLLVFPEGRRTPDGEMKDFRPGIGLLAVRLRLSVVPVHIEGLFEVLSVHDDWPKPGPARIRFGEPLKFHESEDYRRVTEVVEARVRELGVSAASPPR